jgi:inosose dehydratase
MVTRREVIKGLALLGPATAADYVLATVEATASMQYGYAAITWGTDYMAAIDDVASLGYRGIQLRFNDGLLDRYGGTPSALRDLLAAKKLAFPVFSSGNLSIDPAREREMFETHTKHARFLRAAGGRYLQVIDERPRGRAVGAADYVRAGRLLTELSRRVADEGVTLVYHHHMNSTGEKPHEVAAVLAAADPRHVRLLFDTAHYQQGGGDPVAAIREYRDWIAVLHLKDVRDRAGGYQFVELGRGRVDLKGVFAALNEINYNGWAIVELDRVPDAGRTPRESADISRRYLVDVMRETI